MFGACFIWLRDLDTKKIGADVYLTQMFLAIIWRYWQAGKITRMRMKVQGLLQAHLIETHQDFETKKFRYFSNRVVYTEMQSVWKGRKLIQTVFRANCRNKYWRVLRRQIVWQDAFRLILLTRDHKQHWIYVNLGHCNLILHACAMRPQSRAS